MRNLQYHFLQRVLKLVPITATLPEVYVSTMNTVLSDSYDYLVDTLNHTNTLKLKDNSVENIADCYYEILVYAERLESAGAFKPNHLGYIICICEDTSDSIFHLWSTQKYKEVMEFVKKLFVCDEDVIQNNDIITYVYLV